MVSRLQRVRRSVRQAYAVARHTLRSARRAADAPPDPPPALPVTSTTPPPPPPPPVVVARPDDEAVPRGLRIAAAWSWRLIVIGFVAYVLLLLINRYMLLVAPLMIGLLLAGLLHPAMRLALKLRLNRSLAALLVVTIGLVALGGTLYLVVNEFVKGLPDMVESAGQGIEDLEEWLVNGPVGLTEAELANLYNQVAGWVEENTQQLTQAGLAAVTGTAQFLTATVLVLVVTFFFLRDGRRIWNFFVGMMPPAARAPMAYAGDGAWGTLGGYIRATVLVALVDAVGIGIGLWILDRTMGMPFVVPLAALVFLGGFVPIVGAFVSGAVAVLVALLSAPGTEGLIKALIVFGIVVAVQQLESNVLQPFIVSRMVRIHPLAVIVAVTAGIMSGGIIGALVATPVVAVINTVARRLSAFHQQQREVAGPGAAAPAAPGPGLPPAASQPPASPPGDRPATPPAT